MVDLPGVVVPWVNEREFADHKPDFDKGQETKGSCCHSVANYVGVKKRTISFVFDRNGLKRADVYAGNDVVTS